MLNTKTEGGDFQRTVSLWDQLPPCDWRRVRETIAEQCAASARRSAAHRRISRDTERGKIRELYRTPEFNQPRVR
jgi:hypothetical protein